MHLGSWPVMVVAKLGLTSPRQAGAGLHTLHWCTKCLGRPAGRVRFLCGWE